MSGIPDAPAALGFAVYSVVIILMLMFMLDVFRRSSTRACAKEC